MAEQNHMSIFTPPDRFDELRRIAVPLLRPYAQRIAVFGSYARGEETEESDIDLLIALRPDGERPPLGLRWFSIEEELSTKLQRRVEMVSDQALNARIRPFVEQDLVMIYAE